MFELDETCKELNPHNSNNIESSLNSSGQNEENATHIYKK